MTTVLQMYKEEKDNAYRKQQFKYLENKEVILSHKD